jgi:hypothetical protein
MDGRVDTAVCRALGIRSILVIPILVNGTVAGLIETVSINTQAFGQSHVNSLENISDYMHHLAYVRAISSAIKNPGSQSQPRFASIAVRDSKEPLLNSELRNAVDNGQQEDLSALRGVLESVGPSSTWEDICEQLVSGLQGQVG